MDIFSAEPAGWVSSSYDQIFLSSWIGPGSFGFPHFIFRLGLPSSVCPKCRSEITGRAHDTEQFLTSAPKADPAQNPAKSKMSSEAKDCETSESMPPQGQNESSGEIQLQPSLEVAENFQEGVQSRQQQSKSGTPKASKRVTWSPSVQK